MIRAIAILLYLCIVTLAYAYSGAINAALLDTDKQDLNAVSIIKNGGFEDGKGRWTASGGTFAIVTSGTNLLTGKVSATWDSGSASQTLTSTAVAIPKGLYGRNGMLQCRIQVPSGTATHTIQAYDGSNIVATATISSSTAPTYTQLNFIFPSSGNISLRLVSVASDEPLIAIDDCWLGDAINITNVSQASVVGSAYFATTASCTWSSTSTSLATMGATAACPGPTVETNPGPGEIQTTDADLPKVTVNNLPPGSYAVFFTAPWSNTGTVGCLAVNDGTDTRGRSCGTGSSGTFSVSGTAVFTYTTTANRSFEIFSSVGGGTGSVDNASANRRLEIVIYRFPGANQQIVSTENSDYDWTAYTPTISAGFGTATSISFFHKRIGDMLHVRGSFTAGTVAASLGTITLPGSLAIDSAKISIANTSAAAGPIVGSYRQDAAANGGHLVTATGTSTALIYFGDRYADTSGLIPQNGSGVASNSGVIAVEFSVPISGWVTSNRAPLLVNSVVNPREGVTQIVSADIANSGTPTVSSQDGSWITSITDNGAGDMTLNIAAGTFSATPRCVCTSKHDAATEAFCVIDTTTTPSSTAQRLRTTSAGSTNLDYPLNVICVGAK